VTAFYSGYRTGHPYQSVLLARSSDGGRSFGEPSLAIDDPDPSENIVFYRDPYVWRGDDAWYLAVGAGYAAGQPAVRLYHSRDLRTWDFLGPLVAGADVHADGLDIGAMWECPQVIMFGETVAVLAGAWRPDTGIGPVLALVGTRDGYRMSQPTATRIDQGPNLYAASVLPGGPDGPTLWGSIIEG
jgi:beta-fructofuranosidase